jgi:hypothetical protein
MARPATPPPAPADAPPPPPLPPPASGLFAEVEFRRLLASCEEVVAGDDKGRPDLRDWAASPVFHHVSCLSAPPFNIAAGTFPRICR